MRGLPERIKQKDLELRITPACAGTTDVYEKDGKKN